MRTRRSLWYPKSPKPRTPWMTSLNPRSTWKSGRDNTPTWTRERRLSLGSTRSEHNFTPKSTMLIGRFDHEGFSVWRVDFKYNDELTQVFMSSNQASGCYTCFRCLANMGQIGGFFNRLEASRKYLFGSMGVLGKANDSIISGAVICRGLDYKPVMDVAPDCKCIFIARIADTNADRGILRVQED